MISSKGISLVFIVAAFVAAAHAVDQGRQKSPTPTFAVKYNSGSFDFKAGTWLKIAFVDTDPGQEGAKPLASVRSDHVTTVQFSTKAEKDSHLLEQMSRSGCAYARTMLPRSGTQFERRTLIIFQVSPGSASRLVEKLNRRHAIRLVWNEDSSERVLLLAVSDCEYAAFLANLRQFLGLRWQTVATNLE